LAGEIHDRETAKSSPKEQSITQRDLNFSEDK